jgi:cellulose synthase/poly-beta-1,6-N-acetylglucosamine synthase-like glycosyltransferase
MVDAESARERLEWAGTGLLRARPDLSAASPLDRGQRRAFMALASVLVVALVVVPQPTLVALVALATAMYAAATIYRVMLFRAALRDDTAVTVTDDDARAAPDESLPLYTVLVPAYREPEVVGGLLAALGRIEYPADRLDVKLLLEADDTETMDAVAMLGDLPFLEVVLVPPSEPRTKPKALNYGLTLARGELVTIYDAEDDPDPLQLRRAAVAMARLGPEVACLQARLSYANADQNLITKWFTAEYTMWFTLFLPGLSALGAPIPLGGTSNHFRREALARLHGWDPYNVTEDADLGLRIARAGGTVRVLDSTTLEEANSDFVNWAKQRSRWYKGYLQTWLVHLRHPRQVWSELGPKAFVQANLFVGGTPVLALLNPIFWLMTLVWFIGHPVGIRDLFPAPIYYAGIACWAFGSFAVIYMMVVSVRIARRPELLVTALVAPIYWIMMSIAAVKAAVQLVTAPSFWEKTTHGLG